MVCRCSQCVLHAIRASADGFAGFSFVSVDAMRNREECVLAS